MPRQKVNYSNTMMYKIVSNDLNIRDCYVGSTTDFTKRKYRHKSDCTNANSEKYNLKVYQFIRNNGNWHNWSMVLIEMYPCTNHLESSQRERFWCENLNATLNSMVPSRSQKEYTVDNKEHIREQHKQYFKTNKEHMTEQHKQYCKTNKEHIREQNKQYKSDHKEQIIQYNIDNRDHITEQSKQYREANREQINNYQNTVLICQCGCSYTRGHKLRHEQTNKHKEHIANKLYYDIRRGLDMIKKLDNYFLNK
jgi:transcription-repair coupling factor (superfamily II helicase)